MQAKTRTRTTRLRFFLLFTVAFHVQVQAVGSCPVLRRHYTFNVELSSRKGGSTPNGAAKFSCFGSHYDLTLLEVDVRWCFGVG